MFECLLFSVDKISNCAPCSLSENEQSCYKWEGIKHNSWWRMCRKTENV